MCWFLEQNKKKLKPDEILKTPELQHKYWGHREYLHDVILTNDPRLYNLALESKVTHYSHKSTQTDENTK